jgi:hypothetical protein
MGGDSQQMKSLKEIAAASVGVAPQAPVAPPQSFGEMVTQQFDQAVAPMQQKFANVSNAVNQFGQGNFTQGVNAYRGYMPQPSVINQHYGVQE